MVQNFRANLSLLKPRFLMVLLYTGLAFTADSSDIDDSSAANSDQGCINRPLNILLTNDDGFDKPGIQALHRVFRQAGHHVVLAAPAKNASGSSTSLTLAKVQVSEKDRDVYAINASPATSVLLGADGFFGKNSPDLVISGINNGANLGPATPVSGTVGATVAAILILQPAVPGIAVSTNPFHSSELSAEKNTENDLQHLANVSNFLLALVGKIQSQHCDGSPLLPPGVALNINYPPLPRDKIKGVKLLSQGKAPLFNLGYARSEKDPSIYLPQFAALPPNRDQSDGDTGAFYDGYITIVPIDGDYSADKSVSDNLAPGLQGLSP
jgi:5'/3'-nucleotidase SurE